ncbi:MAG: 8-oxoguanine deaminase [Phycisphaerae bacterium]|nr:8-oxoguanine deaminase [Phycisphaerae bacterium]
MLTLIRNTTLISYCPAPIDAVQVLPHTDILCRHHLIEQIAATGTMTIPPGTEIVEGSRHLTIPGLINTHHHLYQTLTRCLPVVQNAGLFRWLTELYQRWQHVDYQAIKLAAQISIAELLLSGCTTTVDHFYLFPRGSDVRLEAVLEAAEELGIRLHAGRGSMTLGQSRGGLPPDSCTEDDAQVLRDSQRVVEAFHDPGPHAMRRIDLAPCAPFNVSEDLFRESARLARALGVRLHTHAAETLDEQRFCQERYGYRPIEYLAEQGWLGRDVYLAHCVHLSPAEIKLLADSGTGVAHCPTSNMRLGSGVAPLTSLLKSGVHVGIAVDGSSSNDGGHLLQEARQAMLLQRVTHGPEVISPEAVFRAATIGGASCLNRPTLGYLAADQCADLAMYRADDIALAGSVVQDPLAALLLGQVGRADRVMVHGRWVVTEGQLTTIDSASLVEKFNNLVKQRFCW